MRAGKLDRVIIVERKTETIDGNGTPKQTGVTYVFVPFISALFRRFSAHF